MTQASILIVDDDPDLTETMRIALETQNYAVSTASNPDEARKQLSQAHPDLIILDVMMETIQDGFILDRELKSDPKFKDIPILMVTSVKERLGLDFKPEAGDPAWLPVEEFLDKPIKPEVLLETVARLIGAE
jgi:CheY-like chemotaxis protein